MWKAVLVLFMTSSTQPIAMMVGQFPETFVKKVECQEFVTKMRGDINGTIKMFTQNANLGFEVVHHEMSCLENEDGEPV
ncbi:MAG: hypothetical protein AAGF14_00685 [Pseudomonadota bacterium]